MVGEVIPFYALRVQDMDRGNVEIIGECYPCGRRGIVSPADVLRHFDPMTYVQQIERRLRCWRCGGPASHMTRRTLGADDPYYRKPPER